MIQLGLTRLIRHSRHEIKKKLSKEKPSIKNQS